MTDKMRWRYGDTNPVVAAVNAETVIEIGDLVWQDIDDAKPAHAFPQRGGWGPTLAGFADAFLGVAMLRSRKGDTDPIRVATTGVFEFDCGVCVFELGDLVCPYLAAGDGSIRSQFVERVDSAKLAIGRVARRVPLPDTTVLIDIHSTIMTGESFRGVDGIPRLDPVFALPRPLVRPLGRIGNRSQKGVIMSWPIHTKCDCGCKAEILLTPRFIRRILRAAYGGELAAGIDDRVIQLMGNGRMTADALNRALYESRRQEGVSPALVFAAFIDQFGAFVALHPGQQVREIDVKYLVKNAALIAGCSAEPQAERSAWWPPACAAG